MKIIWTTFFLITNLCLGMAQKYEIKSSLELLKILREQNGQILSENEEDLSCAYTINNNKIVWLPASGGKGIVFEDEATMREVLKNGVPIEDDNYNPFKSNQEHLVNIASEINYWLKILSEKLDLEIDVNKDDASYYKEISKRVNKIDPDDRNTDLFIPLGIFIGEKIKRGTSAHWQVEKKYGYRPYFMPILIDASEKKYHPWYKLYEHLSKKKFDFDKYLTLVNSLGAL